MRFWLCITNRANWKVIRDKNVWGVPRKHRNTIAKVKPVKLGEVEFKPLIPKLKFITNKKL